MSVCCSFCVTYLLLLLMYFSHSTDSLSIARCLQFNKLYFSPPLLSKRCCCVFFRGQCRNQLDLLFAFFFCSTTTTVFHMIDSGCCRFYAPLRSIKIKSLARAVDDARRKDTQKKQHWWQKISSDIDKNLHRAIRNVLKSDFVIEIGEWTKWELLGLEKYFREKKTPFHSELNVDLTRWRVKNASNLDGRISKRVKINLIKSPNKLNFKLMIFPIVETRRYANETTKMFNISWQP